jgi:hypothetical protein
MSSNKKVLPEQKHPALVLRKYSPTSQLRWFEGVG